MMFPETVRRVRLTPGGWGTDGTYSWGTIPDETTDPAAFVEILATVIPLSGEDTEILPEGYRNAFGLKLVVDRSTDIRTAKAKRHPGTIPAGTLVNPDMSESPPDLIVLDGEFFVVQSVTDYRSTAPIPCREVVILRAAETEWLSVLSPVTP